ncbi:SixA phosphatase family protein [Brachybacterium huguangmaarense]
MTTATPGPTGDPDSRILLLMRHGKAEAFGEQDIDRPLAERGGQQARLVGDYLESQGVRPGRVLVSAALRTRETWDALVAAMPGFDGEVTFTEDIYAGGPAEVADLVRGVEDDDRIVLVVGHEPTMSTLSHQLADDDSDPGAAAQARIGLPTGSMCVLSGSLASWRDLGEDSLALLTVVRG